MASQQARRPAGPAGPRLARIAPRMGLLCAFIIMLFVFGHHSPTFLGATNVWEVLRTSAPVIIVSVGIVFPLIAGQIDISVGSIVGVVGMVAFNLLTGWHWPAWAAIIVALLVACVLGLVNGLLVTGLRLHSVLVTLGTYTAYRGIVQLISTKSQVGVASITSSAYGWIGNGDLGPVPAPIVIVGALAGWHGSFFVHSSRPRVCAVGGNVTSARHAGLHVSRTVIVAYILSALSAGVGAIILTSLLTTTTVTLGQGYELTAITAAVMGGVSLFGGVGDIPGALLGVLFLSFLSNGFSFLNYPPQVNEIVTGGILVVAVALDQGVRRTLPTAAPGATRHSAGRGYRDGGSMNARLEAHAVAKQYERTQALRGVDLQVLGGEVHGLVGADGTGKSTLIKVLTGITAPDTGSVTVDGVPLALGQPEAALRAGLVAVYQDEQLVPEMTVLDNLMLGRYQSRALAPLPRRRARRILEQETDQLGFPLPLGSLVAELSQVRRKEVDRQALTRSASVLLLDEPTAALPESDASHLLDIIGRVATTGVAVIFISHILEQVLSVCDRVTVLSSGTRVGTWPCPMEKASLLNAMFLNYPKWSPHLLALVNLGHR